MQMKTNSTWMGAAIGFALLLLFAAPQKAVAQWTTASNGNDVYKTNTTGNVGVGTASPGQPVEVKAASPAIRFNGTSAGAIYDIGILPNVEHDRLQRDDKKNANTIFRIIQNGTGADYTGYGAGHLMGQWQIFGTNYVADQTNAEYLSINAWSGSENFSATNGFSFNSNSSGTGTPRPITFAMNGTTRLLIGTSGNVGIGTTSPANPGGFDTILAIAKASGNPALTLQGTRTWQLGHNSLGGFSIYDGTAAALRLIIDTSGNVEIATSPASGTKLDLNGNTNVTGNLNATGTINAAGRWSVNGTPITSSQWSSSTNGINFNSGNVGIGTIPGTGNKLDVTGNTNVTGDINATGTINATTGLKINGSTVTSSQWTNGSGNISYTGGNVGIGSAPGTGYKLDVTGNLNASGTITGGDNLSRDPDIDQAGPSAAP